MLLCDSRRWSPILPPATISLPGSSTSNRQIYCLLWRGCQRVYSITTLWEGPPALPFSLKMQNRLQPYAWMQSTRMLSPNYAILPHHSVRGVHRCHVQGIRRRRAFIILHHMTPTSIATILLQRHYSAATLIFLPASILPLFHCFSLFFCCTGCNTATIGSKEDGQGER